MSLSGDLAGGFVAVLLVIGIYAVYLGAILAFLWVVWNWIVLPTLPYIAGVFA
jgi:hypothetical protein